VEFKLPIILTSVFLAGVLIGVYIVHPFIWSRICKPDLLVENYTTEYVGGHYNVDVTVKNDGCAKSDECLVYCNAISTAPPVGQSDIRVHQSWSLEELQPGETATCSFSFTVQMLGNQTVGIIEILVDAKGMVEESNENNNIEWWTY